MMKKLLSLITLFLFVVQQTNAQQQIEMADAFRADGKIYVVVGILSLVFTGIVLFLIRLEMKVSKLEKEQK